MTSAYSLTIIQQIPCTVALSIIIFIISLLGIYNHELFLKLLLHPCSIFKQHQLYRLLTSDMVHTNLLHLGINLFLLLFVAGRLESYLSSHFEQGSFLFLCIYISSMLSGSITVSLIHQNDFNYTSAGASGTLFGVMMSYMILQPNVEGIYVIGLGSIKNMYSVLLFMIGFIVYQMKNKNSSINNELHFFSAIGGTVTTFLLFHSVIF